MNLLDDMNVLVNGKKLERGKDGDSGLEKAPGQKIGDDFRCERHFFIDIAGKSNLAAHQIPTDAKCVTCGQLWRDGEWVQKHGVDIMKEAVDAGSD